MTKNPKTSKTQIRYSSNHVSRALDRVASEPTERGCLLWGGAVNNGGYGHVRLVGRNVKTHRLAWAFGLSGERHGALPPPGVVIRHRCDNPRCNNPEHLQAGSKADNVADRYERGRCARGDANGSRKHRERMPRGDDHWSRKHLELVARGEAAGRAKLSDEAVKKIFLLRAEGRTLQAIAEMVGCSKVNISYILRGLTRVPLAPKEPA